MRLGWVYLPREIRVLIWQNLIQDGCTLSCLATVSREWQTEFERHNFARIKLKPSRLADFGSMVDRNRALVKYIWFCLELDEYDCTTCAPASRVITEEYEKALSVTDSDGCSIPTAFQNLFSILSTWDPRGDLVLDISIYSPSDADHWFKYLTFVPDIASDMLDGIVEQAISDKVKDDPQHGWIAGVRHSAPPRHALNKVFHSVMEDGPFDSAQSEYQWWDQLPSVPAVKILLLRQQNRRRWLPRSLAHMFARFPRLQEIHYEPWREWCGLQMLTDRDFQYLFETLPQSNTNLKRLVVFENFNQQYPAIMQGRYAPEISGCVSIRDPTPAVSQKVALASLKLEQLAASFIVDASQFLEIEPAWEWPNLKSIALTSKLLTPDTDPGDIGIMLQATAAAAVKMPRLETMEIWNARQGLAALFRYQVFHDTHDATITWRGTWKLTVRPLVILAWETVLHRQHVNYGLNLAQEWLDKATINSHADAIDYLMLSSQVIRPVSLQQIRTEQQSLHTVPT